MGKGKTERKQKKGGTEEEDEQRAQQKDSHHSAPSLTHPPCFSLLFLFFSRGLSFSSSPFKKKRGRAKGERRKEGVFLRLGGKKPLDLLFFHHPPPLRIAKGGFAITPPLPLSALEPLPKNDNV